MNGAYYKSRLRRLQNLATGLPLPDMLLLGNRTQDTQTNEFIYQCYFGCGVMKNLLFSKHLFIVEGLYLYTAPQPSTASTTFVTQ